MLVSSNIDYAVAVFTLQSGLNTAIVLLGTTCLGVASGIVGSFSLLRKRALMGDALAHGTLPGVCISFLLLAVVFQSERSLTALLAGGAGTGILAVYTVHLISRHTRLPEDAAIGAVLSVFFGVGVLLLSIIQSLGTGAEGGLHHFIYGQTAAMSINDAKLTALLALFSAAAALLLLKEFRLLCFDPVFALVQGWPVALLDLLMMALVVLVTVTGLQSVGIILVIALLIIPPAAARFWGEKLSFLLLLSAFIGGLSGYLGAGISALLPRMPAGAIIVLVSSGVFLLSFLFAPRRGLVAALIRRLSIRLRVTSEHILRRLYEECERRGSDVHPHIPRSVIDPRRPRLSDSLILWLLRRRGLLSSSSALDSLEFTQAGLAEAARLVRNHRLWEEYVHRFGELAVSHVDYSADFVEHAISPEIVAELECLIGTRGEVAQSIHKITTAAPAG